MQDFVPSTGWTLSTSGRQRERGPNIVYTRNLPRFRLSPIQKLRFRNLGCYSETWLPQMESLTGLSRSSLSAPAQVHLRSAANLLPNDKNTRSSARAQHCIFAARQGIRARVQARQRSNAHSKAPAQHSISACHMIRTLAQVCPRSAAYLVAK